MRRRKAPETHGNFVESLRSTNTASATFDIETHPEAREAIAGDPPPAASDDPPRADIGASDADKDDEQRKEL